MTPRLIWWRRDKYFQDPFSSYVLVRPLRVSHSNMVQYMEIVLSCQHSLSRDNLILIPHTKPPSTKSLQSERQIKITSEMEFCTNDALYGVICLT